MANNYTASKAIDLYMARFKKSTPRQILHKMGELRDFFFKYMTLDGRAFFESKHLGRRDTLEHSLLDNKYSPSSLDERVSS